MILNNFVQAWWAAMVILHGEYGLSQGYMITGEERRMIAKISVHTEKYHDVSCSCFHVSSKILPIDSV